MQLVANLCIVSSHTTEGQSVACLLNLFTLETWAVFHKYRAGVSGFRHSQRRMATEELKPGDVFLC